MREKTVAFTGYRTKKIVETGVGETTIDMIHNHLLKEIEKLYHKGYRRFLSGMAHGFDMYAAEAVLELKNSYSDIELVAVVPYIGQHSSFSNDEKLIYANILGRADEVVTLSKAYTHTVYHDRNDYLVENASFIVCYYNGLKGGTKYTLDKAKKAKLPIINIFDTIFNPTIF